MGQQQTQQELEKLSAHGPLSAIVNNNVEVLKRSLTKKEVSDLYLDVDDGTAVIKGKLVVNGLVKGTDKLRVKKQMQIRGELTTSSDARLKEDIAPLSGCLRKVLGLQAFSYSRSDWREANIPENERYIGLLAQHVQDLLPDLVKSGNTTDDLLSVDYPALFAVLIEAVKEIYKNYRSSQIEVY